MRTTLDIADDVLQAVKERARYERKTAGEVISELARQALTNPSTPGVTGEPKSVFGVRPFPSGGHLVTNDLIDKLREDDAY